MMGIAINRNTWIIGYLGIWVFSYPRIRRKAAFFRLFNHFKPFKIKPNSMQQNQRSRPLPKGRGINTNGKILDETWIKKYFPTIGLINEDTGEVHQLYRYKARFNFMEKYRVHKDKPFYNYPDYLIVQEYYRRHGKTFPTVKFLDMMRDLVIQREWKCIDVIIYDNTGIIPGNIMYHTMNVEGEGLKVLVNYLFPDKKPYIIHPKSIEK
jgi:hypothetical protein